eukprot:NODE_10998_length_473_cov_0.950867_g10975_i0.p1 GENE.NODE_10998_length_473_cov_0.950867_g10975_i0~~NODE_10998_length_473_cov_0.950867_g10975_i0.p1  ORF type:complete len:110 (+),score=6.13 NODE_10998_length_473_cov_0.950867_g10975_i0:89-418(+)
MEPAAKRQRIEQMRTDSFKSREDAQAALNDLSDPVYWKEDDMAQLFQKLQRQVKDGTYPARPVNPENMDGVLVASTPSMFSGFWRAGYAASLTCRCNFWNSCGMSSSVQ